MEEVVRSLCECTCGDHEGEVEFVIDPYDEDVNNTEVWRWLCAKCYEHHVMDI